MGRVVSWRVRFFRRVELHGGKRGYLHHGVLETCLLKLSGSTRVVAARHCGFVGDKPDGIEEYAWVFINSDRKRHPVRTRKANSLGLFDMQGNVRRMV